MSRRYSLETVRIASPCGGGWETMEGTAEARFCEHCSRHVHGLSAVTRREAERIVAASNRRPCVRYVPAPQGRATFRPEPLTTIARRGSRVAAGALGAALAFAP